MSILRGGEGRSGRGPNGKEIMEWRAIGKEKEATERGWRTGAEGEEATRLTASKLAEVDFYRRLLQRPFYQWD